MNTTKEGVLNEIILGGPRWIVDKGKYKAEVKH
jgi:hypothetical protein